MVRPYIAPSPVMDELGKVMTQFGAGKRYQLPPGLMDQALSTTGNLPGPTAEGFDFSDDALSIGGTPRGGPFSPTPAGSLGNYQFEKKEFEAPKPQQAAPEESSGFEIGPDLLVGLGPMVADLFLTGGRYIPEAGKAGLAGLESLKGQREQKQKSATERDKQEREFLYDESLLERKLEAQKELEKMKAENPADIGDLLGLYKHMTVQEGIQNRFDKGLESSNKRAEAQQAAMDERLRKQQEAADRRLEKQLGAARGRFESVQEMERQKASYTRKQDVQDALHKKGFGELGPALSSVIKYTQMKDIPGVGQTGSFPKFLLSREGKDARQAIQKLANIVIQARSGAAVTPQEFERLVEELQTNWMSDDESFRQGIRSAIDTFRNEYDIIRRASDPKAFEEVTKGLNIPNFDPSSVGPQGSSGSRSGLSAIQAERERRKRGK